MADDQLITCGDGVTLRTTEDGTGLCTGDCESPPQPCCPSVCGERFEVCITRYVKVSREIVTEEILMPSGDWALYGRRDTRYRQEYLDTPTKLGVWLGSGVCVATGRVLARTTTEFKEDAGVDYRASDCGTFVRDPGGVLVHTRRIEDECLDRGYGCYDSQGVISDGVYTGFLAGGEETAIPGTFPVTAAAQYSTGVYGNYTGERIVHNQFRAGRGPGYFLGTQTMEATAQLPVEVCSIDGVTNRSRRLRWTREESVEIRWTLSTLVTCDGSAPDAPCAGEPPESCDGGLQYIPGVPCVGQGQEVPPVVFLAENVLTCRTMRSGGFCYRVSPSTPRLSDPDGAAVDYGIVASWTGFPDCCACLLCGNTIAAYPCWQNFARAFDGTPIVTPAFIEDGHCCCDPFDLITIARVDNTLIGFGQRQEWRLRGAPLSFRRNQVNAVPLDQLVSAVTVYDADTGQQTGTFDYFHGQFLNAPPMGCQWDQLGSPVYQFDAPADGVAAGPLGQNGLLPCPADPNGERGPWRLLLWSVAVTCRTFSFAGDWVNAGNGLRLSTRTLFNVTPPPDAEYRRCGGGCYKPETGDSLAPGPISPAPFPGPIGPFGIGDLREIIGGG